MEKGGNQGKTSKQQKSSEGNTGKGGKNQKKNNQGGNSSKPQYAPKSNAHKQSFQENTAPNDQITKVEDLTDELLLKESE